MNQPPDDSASSEERGEARRWWERCGLHRAGILLALFLLPIAYLVWQAFFDPTIEFLRPSWVSRWILYPDQEIYKLEWEEPAAPGSTAPRRVTEDVLFVRDFEVGSTVPALTLEAQAFQSLIVTLNGTPIVPREAVTSWKRTVRFDLTPGLRPGPNRIEIRVSNPGSVPALLVESPELLRTDREWMAAVGPDFGELTAAVFPLKIRENPGPLQRWGAWPMVRWVGWAWIVLVAGMGLLSAFRRGNWSSPEASDPAPVPPPRWLRWTVPIVLWAGILGLDTFNTQRYPPYYSTFDWSGHVEYVRHMAHEGRPPLAAEGWQMYHPPLYYWIAGTLFRWTGGDDAMSVSIKTVQYLGCLSTWLLILFTWLTARLIFPRDPRAGWVVLLFAGFSPMCLYLAPLVTNEMFSAATIAVAIYFGLRWGRKESISWPQILFLGLLSGLALLVKFTGLMIFLSLILFLGLRALRRGASGDWARLLVFPGVVLILCGWFYARNIQEYGTPTFRNTHKDSRFQVEQPPGYRTLGACLQFGSVLFRSPERQDADSNLDGLYASFWGDGKRCFFPPDDTKRRHPDFPDHHGQRGLFWMGIMLFLGLLPTLAMVLGLVQTARSVFRRPGFNVDLILLAVFLWTWWGLMIFILEIPMWPALKAFYFISLMPAFGVALLRGREVLRVTVPHSQPLLDGTLVAMALMAAWIFRFPVVPF